ncbi:Cyclin pch1 [Grifola frondosa]|uniref:Cyclin pch1 n=1 Tax=Grifola frondosa TaxID=5627 RepID=A0A1C7MFP1_GRIFR|nr:Cyclin pch1 [Grifola frondosa]
MNSRHLSLTSSIQWLFPITALQYTPSRTTSDISLEKELYDRSRGIEFLYRLAVSLGLPASAMYTAATWFHRFYMRYSMEDYHRQDVAASCIFLATKTEECGRKLRDVAKVFCSKVSKIDVVDIPDDSKDVEECQNNILLTEEVLLEALCFDFVVDSPQVELVDLFDAQQEDPHVEECAWSIANDSFRTPLCILYPTRIIAAACYVLAQYVVEGPQSPPLDVRIASPAPSASLPTPPSHKPPSPETSRFAVEYFGFNEVELAGVAEALRIMIEYYGAQDLHSAYDYLASVAAIKPPSSSANREQLYLPFAHAVPPSNPPLSSSTPNPVAGQTPTSSHGGNTPDITNSG